MSVSVVTIGVAELRALVAEAVEAALVAASRRQAAGSQRLSAADAARLAKRRRSLILAACASGALPARRTGKNWGIKAEDLDRWCSAGCPEKKS